MVEKEALVRKFNFFYIHSPLYVLLRFVGFTLDFFRTNELMNKVVEKSCVRQEKKGGALIEIVS